MLLIKPDNSIALTRGDTAYLDISIINDVTKEPYALAADDTLTLSVKRTIKDDAPCLQKAVTGTNSFKITHADTCQLSFGMYQYDVELNTADGDTFTVVGPASLELLKEVTC